MSADTNPGFYIHDRNPETQTVEQLVGARDAEFDSAMDKLQSAFAYMRQSSNNLPSNSPRTTSLILLSLRIIVAKVEIVALHAGISLPPELQAGLSGISVRNLLKEEKKAEMIVLMQEGITLTAIAKRLGISMSSINTYQKELVAEGRIVPKRRESHVPPPVQVRQPRTSSAIDRSVIRRATSEIATPKPVASVVETEAPSATKVQPPLMEFSDRAREALTQSDRGFFDTMVTALAQGETDLHTIVTRYNAISRRPPIRMGEEVYLFNEIKLAMGLKLRLDTDTRQIRNS